MEAALSEQLGIDAELIEGDNGVFDVVADGRLVYSKDQTGRFPENDEVVKAIKALR